MWGALVGILNSRYNWLISYHKSRVSANMLEVVTAYIEQHRLLPESGRVVVAVSGGADSLCLLHLLHGLCGAGRRYPAVQLHVAHLDHQLRGEAGARDAAIVADLATEWGLPVTTGAADVPTLARNMHYSLEEAARIARYRFLNEVAQGRPIAVAHQQDDQVETLLLHWLRGGGIASMTGLRPRDLGIIRPLLCVTHADTVAYCREHQLTPLEDASNSDLRFLRNRVRHELLPLLESLNPGIRATILRTAEIMNVDAEWIEEQIDNCRDNVIAAEGPWRVELRRDALLALPLSLQRHLLRRVTGGLNAGQSPLELRHYKLIEELLQRPDASEAPGFDLPQHIRVTRENEMLIFERVDVTRTHQGSSDERTEAVLPVPGRVAVPGTRWIATAEIVQGEELQQAVEALRGERWADVWRTLPSTRYAVYIDGEHISDALRVRTRRAGDRMRPLGMACEKKVQDVLVDKHIPSAERGQIPLFFSETHCVWLAGIYPDDRVRLTARTRRIVRLSLREALA
jgi:tRNA(Ile)-lysidine synthase